MYAVTQSVDLLNVISGAAPVLVAVLGVALMGLLVGVVSFSNTLQGSDFVRTDVITATADKTVTFPHGLGAISTAAVVAAMRGVGPLDVALLPLTADFYLCDWILSSVNLTNVVLVKRSQSLSGGAAPSTRLTIKRPHSIGR
jgi:xanthosine utilization system XapX-like protein